LLGKDGEHVANRVAFIEKTPRIRVRSQGHGEFEKDYLNWASGPFKGSGPEDAEARAWCDEALGIFDYQVDDPVKDNWRASM
jgi:hypothetical protein